MNMRIFKHAFIALGAASSAGRGCGGRAALSGARHNVHCRVRAGRRCRHAGASCRQGPGRKAGANRRGGKPRRCGRQHRGGRRRARGTRRLHAAGHDHGGGDQRNPAPEQGICGERFKADRHRRVVAGSLRHRPSQSRRQSRRIPQKRERQEHYLRFGRRRQRLAYRGRIFLQGDRQVSMPCTYRSKAARRQSPRPSATRSISWRRRLAAARRRRSRTASSRVLASPATNARRSRRTCRPTRRPAIRSTRRPGSACSRRPALVRRSSAKLNATIEQVMKDPALRQKLTAIGFDPIEGSQEQADTYFKAEVAKWGKMVKTLESFDQVGRRTAIAYRYQLLAA